MMSPGAGGFGADAGADATGLGRAGASGGALFPGPADAGGSAAATDALAEALPEGAVAASALGRLDALGAL